MKNITEAINYASEILKKNGIPNHRMEANSLLSLALKKDRTFLISHNEYELAEGELQTFNEFVGRRANREPFQHISGQQEFFGLEFAVSPAVLIPRPETELIVEASIKFLSGKDGLKFCEIGVGSGCISIAVLKNVENVSAVSTDISGSAVEIAKTNAEKHGVTDRINFCQSNLFGEIQPQEFDLIVSNPPYIPEEDFDDLQIEVRDFDPRTALTDEGDGLFIIEKLVVQAPNWLKKEGLLLIEIGIDQAESVSEFFSSDIWRSVEFVDDLQGIPRMAQAQKR